MKKRAFTLVEVALTITLVGVLGALSYFYLNLSTLSAIQYKATIQSQINLIESMTFQCKNLSEQFPKELDAGTNASNTLLTELECNTTVPYTFNGGNNGFVPIPPANFSPYRATETGSVFYVMTYAENNSTQDNALKKLIINYTAQQATLDHNATSAIFKFYLSR